MEAKVRAMFDFGRGRWRWRWSMVDGRWSRYGEVRGSKYHMELECGMFCGCFVEDTCTNTAIFVKG